MLTTFRDIWTGCRPGGHGGIFRVLTGQRSELDGRSGDTAMSTIPKPDRSAASPRRSERIKSPKTTSPSAKTVAGPPGASKPLASLKYGWRDVPKKLADGRIKVERVPLTLDDVVHPQFGDVHVLSDAHDDDCSYMKDVLKDRYRDNSVNRCGFRAPGPLNTSTAAGRCRGCCTPGSHSYPGPRHEPPARVIRNRG